MFPSLGRLVAVSLWANTHAGIPMGFSGFYAGNPQESGQIQKGHFWFSPIPLLLKVYAIPKWTQYIYKHLENILFLTNRTRWQRTNEGYRRPIPKYKEYPQNAYSPEASITPFRSSEKWIHPLGEGMLAETESAGHAVCLLYFLSLLEGYWIKFVFILCVPWLIIKISIIVLTPRSRQLPCALFVRRWRFRLVKNRNGIRV